MLDMKILQTVSPDEQISPRSPRYLTNQTDKNETQTQQMRTPTVASQHEESQVSRADRYREVQTLRDALMSYSTTESVLSDSMTYKVKLSKLQRRGTANDNENTQSKTMYIVIKRLQLEFDMKKSTLVVLNDITDQYKSSML